MVHITVEKVLAADLVAFGQAQHLPAQCGQATVIGVKLIDQIFDLLLVELNALHLSRQTFAQRLIVVLGLLAQRIAVRHGEHARFLRPGKAAKDFGDGRELLKRHRLERFFHLGEGEGVVLFLFLFVPAGAAFGQAVLILVGVGGFLFGLLLFLEAWPCGLLADFAVVVLCALFQIFGRRGPSRAWHRDRESRAAASRRC